MTLEQTHVDRVHARVETLRRAAVERRARAEADRSGSTFQAVYERDVTAYHHAKRASRYTFGDEQSLVFGRLDETDGEVLHIGRVSVTDEDKDLLLVDWRAPAAAPFYQATAATPLGVARRRTLTCRGAELLDLDDELLDVEAADRLGIEAVTGQGALLASLTRARTGRMRDIVATIQADQDRIIRRPATGTVIVTGGPGTGKTVVALHRVAYLLYSHRERFENRGVLVVGPTTAFTRYIENVLPSLGEESAVLRSLGDLTEGRLAVSGWDEPDVAAVKGSLAMVDVCRAAVRAVLPRVEQPLEVMVQGTPARVEATELERIRDRIWSRTRGTDDDGRGGYHARRQELSDAVRAELWKAWRRALRGAGRRVPDERVGSGFDTAVVDHPVLEQALDALWPELDAADVLSALATGRVDLTRVTDGLPDDAARLLLEVWSAGAVPRFTVDDVALLDEIQHLLGDPQPDAGTNPEADGGIRLSVERLESHVTRPDVHAPGYRDFAHVVVDEAQDLTPMQWRMLARRGPHASWTIVGDLAQRSRIAEPRTWDDVARLVGRRDVAIERLDVNYRTPAEVMQLAREVLRAAGLDPDLAPTAVRETGERPTLIRSEHVLDEAVARAVDRARAQPGTVAVVVPHDDLAGAIARLEDRLAATDGSVRADLLDRVRVLDPRTVKGLEFDAVVVAHPDAIATTPGVGLHQLYVAVTRATRELVLVAEPMGRIPGAEVTAEERPAA